MLEHLTGGSAENSIGSIQAALSRVAAMLLTLSATAQASADGDASRGKTLFTR